MDNEQLIKTLRATRGYYVQHVADLSEEQLLQEPPAAGHNILWNIGHIIYTNCSVVYGPCGLKSPIPDSYESMFKGGTGPKDWTVKPSISEVMDMLKSTNDTIINDFKAGKFAAYAKLQLVPGYALETAENAFAFNLFHEGIHIGMVMSLRKQIGAKPVH